MAAIKFDLKRFLVVNVFMCVSHRKSSPPTEQTTKLSPKEKASFQSGREKGTMKSRMKMGEHETSISLSTAIDA